MAIVRRSYVYQATSGTMLTLQAAVSAAVGPQNMRPAIQISYDDTVPGVVTDLDTYMDSIGYVPGDGKVAYDPTVTPTDAPSGSLIVDANGMWWRKRDSVSSTNVDKITDPTELTELAPIPEGRTGGNGSLAAPTTLAGAAFIVNRRCLMNRLIVRVTAGGGVTSLGRILLYQAVDGASRDPTTNLVSLVGQITGFNFTGTGNFVVAFDAAATVDVQKGWLFVLWGRESGSNFTLRTYLTQATDLQNANVDLDTHPTQFTTTIAANAVTPAATFDPRQTPTGAATATSASDAALDFRLKKV